MACANAKIPNVNIYKEIPFVDAPEAVAITTVTREESFITPPEWAAIRPYMLCVDDKGWGMIKKQWLEACRYAGKKCNIEVESIGTLIKQLDDIASKIVPRMTILEDLP